MRNGDADKIKKMANLQRSHFPCKPLKEIPNKWRHGSEIVNKKGGPNMNRDEAAAFVKNHLKDYLISIGIKNLDKNFKCATGLHEDNNPSMHFYEDGEFGPGCWCYSCRKRFSTVDLIKARYHLQNTGDAFRKAYEIFGLQVDGVTSPAATGSHSSTRPPETITPPAEGEQNKEQKPAAEKKEEMEKRAAMEKYREECQERLQETDYYEKRGISYQTALRYGVGYDPHCTIGGLRPYPAVIFFTGKDSVVARNISDNVGKEYRYRKINGSNNFNIAALDDPATPVFITEGEMDALSILEVGAQAVGLGSTSNVNKFMKIIKSKKEHGEALPILILSLDNDNAGEDAAKDLGQMLEEAAIPYCKINISGDCKDANEALVKNRDMFSAAVSAAVSEAGPAAEAQAQEKKRAEIEEFRESNSNAGYLQKFLDDIASSAKNPCIPTGFTTIDNELDGGLYPGLYAVGGISSLGKTTLIQQIGDNIARAGQDVLLISLEMSKEELIAKSISRITLEIVLAMGKDRSLAKTTRGILAGSRYEMYSPEEKKLIEDAVSGYASYADKIFIREGIGDMGVSQIREIVKTHEQKTGRAPVVIVDYLQILAPYNPRGTDKQNMDKSVIELKRLSRDFSTPVICISSFNRASYKEEVDMRAFKESGAIEYSCDVLMGLQLAGAGTEEFNEQEAKQQDPRDVEAVILKNRNGRSGGKIALEFYPMHNFFKEP